jgi:hypothetical protein
VNAGDLFDVLAAAPPVPDIPKAVRAAAIEWRAKDEVHGCSFCPARATAAVFTGPGELFGRPRWVDACARCFGELIRVAAEPMWRPENNAELIEEYERWECTRDQGSWRGPGPAGQAADADPRPDQRGG